MRKEKWEELKSYLEELRVISVEPVLTPHGFLSTTGAYYHLNNGKTIYREKIEKNRGDGSAAIIMPVTVDGECILAVEPRVHTKATVGVGFPAGYMNDGEHYFDAAERELLEETGYKADDLKYLAEFYQDEGCSAAYNYGVLATNCRKIAEQKLDEGEFVRYFTCGLDDVEELIDKKYILGANSQLIYEKAKQYIKNNMVY